MFPPPYIKLVVPLFTVTKVFVAGASLPPPNIVVAVPPVNVTFAAVVVPPALFAPYAVVVVPPLITKLDVPTSPVVLDPP